MNQNSLQKENSTKCDILLSSTSDNPNETTAKNPRPISSSGTQGASSSNEAELSSIREQLYSNPDFSNYSTEKLEEFNSYLREYSTCKGMQEDYDEAIRAKDLSDKILTEISSRSTQIQKQSEPPNNFENKKSQLLSKWQDKINSYDEETEKKRQALKNRHEEETNQFEETWRNEMPRKYRKPTARLLQLKTIEKSYAASGNFIKAKAVHQEVDSMARSEMEAAQSNLNHDYEVAQKRLIEKQRKELERFEESRLHSKQCLLAQQNHEMEAMVNRNKVVHNKAHTINKPRSQLQYASSRILYQSNKKNNTDDVLLPPLRAPNDPSVKEEQMKKKRETDRVKYQYQRRNAEETLQRYKLDSYKKASSVNNSRLQNLRNNRRVNDKATFVEVKNGIRIVDKKLLQPPENKIEDNGKVEIGIETNQGDEINNNGGTSLIGDIVNTIAPEEDQITNPKVESNE